MSHPMHTQQRWWPDTQVRFNSGFWDGVADAREGKGQRSYGPTLTREGRWLYALPEDDTPYCVGYGYGYQAAAQGREPETSTVAWAEALAQGTVTT